MNYSECLEIINQQLDRIGEDFTKDGEEFEIEEIVICSPELIILWIEDFNRTGNAALANERNMVRQDLEVYVYCLNLTSNNHTILTLEDSNS